GGALEVAGDVGSLERLHRLPVSRQRLDVVGAQLRITTLGRAWRPDRPRTADPFGNAFLQREDLPLWSRVRTAPHHDPRLAVDQADRDLQVAARSLQASVDQMSGAEILRELAGIGAAGGL